MQVSFGSSSKRKIGTKVVWHNLFNSIFKLFIYLWLCWVFIAMQPCRVTFLQVRRSVRGYSSHGAWPSLAAEHRLRVTLAAAAAAPGLWSTGSIVEVHGLSSPVARGIFPDKGSNLCLLHWQADSEPPGKPVLIVFDLKILCSFSL